MMNARQMCDVMNKRDDIVKEYCKKHKLGNLEMFQLTQKQAEEIKASPEWRKSSKLPEGY